MVIQVHSANRFPVLFSLCPTLHLSPYSRYLTLNIFLLGAMVTINSTSGSADKNISHFHPKQ